MKTSLDSCHLIKFIISCTSSTNTEAALWALSWARYWDTKVFTPEESTQELTKKYLLVAYHVLKNTSDIARHKSKNVNLNSQNA